MRVSLPLLVALVAVITAVSPADEGANLLPNGGFEKDTNGDGIADGWVAQPGNFSRETLADLQAYIRDLPPYERLLEGQKILGVDGSALFERQADGSWGSMLDWRRDERSWIAEENWYARLRREYLPQNSRFGELPVPDGLDLGTTTLLLSARQTTQVVSLPIGVKPDTGYRLAFWVRGGAGFLWWGPQVLDGRCDPEKDVTAYPRPSAIPGLGEHYENPNVLNSLPAAYWHGPGIAGRYWARMEIPFRTGPTCDRIVIRLPYELNSARRMWYDDLRLFQDDSVQLGEVGDSATTPPAWPPTASERGFATAPRPTLPPTYGSHMPAAAEVDAPLRLTLAAGETDSAVLFIRNLRDEDVVLEAEPSHLISDNGYGLQGGGGARFVQIRAAEMVRRALTSKRFVVTPKFLLNSGEMLVSAKGSGQYWLTVSVPAGTPVGKYVGSVRITRVKPGDGDMAARELRVPVELIVRDLVLEEADVAFFTWYHTALVSDNSVFPSMPGAAPSSSLPGAEEIYLADQRRHGMNTVATHCFAERRAKDGKVHVTFNELDATVELVRRAGLCHKQPLLLYAWSGPLKPDWGFFADGESTVRALATHARETGWPSFLLCVSDEPSSAEAAARIGRVMGDYARPRKEGLVRTAVADASRVLLRPLDKQGHTLGDLYDVWIEAYEGHLLHGDDGDWPSMWRTAASHHAELWMYNCWTTGVGYLQERFYAGLWTWASGAKGNGVWAYGNYVRINGITGVGSGFDSSRAGLLAVYGNAAQVNGPGLPESTIAWEGRMAGVNDYRYLQTLEHAVQLAERLGKARDAARGARAFLETLRKRIPCTAYRSRPNGDFQQQWAELDAWNPVPEIRPEDYARIRDECADHISALRKACGL